MVTRSPAWLEALAETLSAVCEANDVMTTVFVMAAMAGMGPSTGKRALVASSFITGQQRVGHRDGDAQERVADQVEGERHDTDVLHGDAVVDRCVLRHLDRLRGGADAVDGAHGLGDCDIGRHYQQFCLARWKALAETLSAVDEGNDVTTTVFVIGCNGL